MHLEEGKRVLREEGEALLAQAERLGEEFARAVEMILGIKGRVVVAAWVGRTGGAESRRHPGQYRYTFVFPSSRGRSPR